MSERMRNIDVALVYELFSEAAAAINDGDLERWLALWVENGIQMPPDAPRRAGKKQIRAAMRPVFNRFCTREMTFHTEEVRILGDWGYAHGRCTYERTPKAGGDTRRCSGSFLDIVKKQVDGSWKIAVDCHSLNESPEEFEAAAGIGAASGTGR
jgi:uncharacterized protein (TIGR02246 family)